MGHFRSVSRKKQHQRRIIIVIMVIIILMLFIKLCKEKLKISEKALKRISFNYMMLDLKEKEAFSQKENNMTNVNNEVKEPLVYIYNTHQTEKYAYQKVNEYNLDYDVLFASQILKANLDDQGIYSIVENTSISNLLKKYQYNYSQSYGISRMLLEQSIIDYPSLRYFIDLHRDSSKYEVTTCSINDINYVRLLFVIGLENVNYQKNKDLAIKLNNKLNQYNECLSRGIMEKKGKGVNGIYNQDFNENVLLIEVGGQYNTIDEVNNTLSILASIIAQTIKENVS